jgi:hypothetical protein
MGQMHTGKFNKAVYSMDYYGSTLLNGYNPFNYDGFTQKAVSYSAKAMFLYLLMKK